MRLLADPYQVFAVDLRGQGRSTWPPGRYSLDTIGNDLVRFIDIVIDRPVVVSGLSSGGTVAAWLAAYAKPGQLRGAVLEDPPVYASELTPAVGHSVRQAMGPVFGLFGKYLGAQWSVGDAQALEAAGMTLADALREYDPEWGQSFADGRMTAGTDHQTMLEQVKVPVLFTHHFDAIDPETIEGAGQTFTYLSIPDEQPPH